MKRTTSGDGRDATYSEREPGEGRTALPPLAPRRESLISVHCQRASYATAADLILHCYGREVRGFLSSRTRDRMSMEEVFSAFSEDVWKGLPGLRPEGRVRSWVYVVARNALARHAKRKQRWRSRHVSAELDELPIEGRSSLPGTSSDLGGLAPLLSQLSAADRDLLEQRLVHARAWAEIALDAASARGVTDSAAVARESARLRKRYQLLVEGLRKQLAQRQAEPAGD